MPGDFAKCFDEKCPSRNLCLRFTAPTARMQDWNDFHRPAGAPRCDSFVANGKA